MSDVNGSADGGQAGGNGGASTSWRDGITDPSLKGLADLKGWDSPDKALLSYKNLESMVGVPPERLLKLPEKLDDPAWGDIKAKLGMAAPEKPEDYELSAPEGFSDDYAKIIAQVAKESGVPKHMLKALQDATNNYSKTAMDALEKAEQQRQTDALAGLRADWGGNYETSMALAQRAEQSVMNETGLSQESVDAWRSADPAGYYKLQAYIGSKMGEARRIDGDTNPENQQMSPEAAKVKLKERMGDKDWFERWERGDVDARSEFKRLNAVIRASQQ